MIDNPTPNNGATNVARQIILRWQDSLAADKYRVYFGVNQDQVTNKETYVYRGEVYTREYNPGVPLMYGTTYYWRITAIVNNQPRSTNPDSSVWAFTVTSAPTQQADERYKTIVCAAANNKFYYESNGQMVELSGLTLDTSVPISMWEAYQKVFIVNGLYKKVVDFVNTKLVISSSPAMIFPPGRGEIIVQAGTGAQMLVDYVPPDKSAIYGIVINGTFLSGSSYTLSGGTLSPSTIYPTQVVSPTVPHHYNWLPYADIKTTLEFGSIPDFLYAGCLFMGACFFGNNPVDPHFWGMTRQGNPYDFAYGADDVQSAAAAGGSEAGRIGDRVLALIPHIGDHLLIGCARSWMILRGLPAAGGVLDLLDNTVGILDKDAWCKGPDGSVFFLASTGLYVIEGISRPRPLSHDTIPRLAQELEASADNKRVTMGYDRLRHGILISVADIQTGANKCYWYDLHTQGFFPEKYPSSMAFFSQLWYDADSPSDRKLLLGCKDGYIRKHEDNQKSDNGEIIESHVLLGPELIATDETSEAWLNQLDISTAGGLPNTQIPNSDNIDYEIYVGDSAEECLEKALLSPRQPLHSGTVYAPGKVISIRKRARGTYAAVRLSNNQANQTFGIETVTGRVIPIAGK